ncbi:outer membrane beta-barrel protein [Helicobacter cetorum]|uniref:outer membrane beta-barrel protein n=1 Tax=Helicobacter cetorum TaxID=138563 RepID=UPI000CF12756|nr:outer membrane beta-barrel protein [Helicobacter cetorum]
MRPLLFIPLAFLVDLRAEESSWYVGGSFLVGQGQQKRTITTLEPPSSPIIPPQIAPQPSPETPKQEPIAPPSPKPQPQEPSQPKPSSPSEPSPQQPDSSQPQPQEPSQKPSPKPPQKPEPERPSQPQPPSPEPSQPSPNIQQQEQQARNEYKQAVEDYRQKKLDAIINAQDNNKKGWEQYQTWCDNQRKGGKDSFNNCLYIEGPNAEKYQQAYNRIFNSENDPKSALPPCPIPDNYPNFPMPQGYNNETLMNQNCYTKDPIVFASLARLSMPNMTNSLYSLLNNKRNQTASSLVSVSSQNSQTSQNPTAITTTTKQTSVHYGGSVALGYKYFFKPRFGLRGYINLEYLYTNTYFSSSNILYGGGADFLANIIDNNDKKSMVFGVFAGVNIAGNTSITQIKNHNASNTKFDAFLHTGLRFVFNGMHEFNLGVRVPFIKNPSVSLKTKDKTYEVQNDMFYSLFVSYYYLF